MPQSEIDYIESWQPETPYHGALLKRNRITAQAGGRKNG